MKNLMFAFFLLLSINIVKAQTLLGIPRSKVIEEVSKIDTMAFVGVDSFNSNLSPFIKYKTKYGKYSYIFFNQNDISYNRVTIIEDRTEYEMAKKFLEATGYSYSNRKKIWLDRKCKTMVEFFDYGKFIMCSVTDLDQSVYLRAVNN